MKSVTHLMCFPTCWIRLALCLAILDMIPPLTGAATKVSARTAENQTSEVLETWEVLAARLLASQLNPNGTLNLATGLRGRRLTSRQGEAPRFAPLNAPGDENWAGNFVLNGITGDVSAMAVSGSNIYVGGSFTTAGGVIANNIAKWDGNTWQPLGSGVSDSACSYSPCVSAIAVDSSGNVYVGGNFTAAGNVSANHIAKWNVSTNSWSALGSGIGGTDAQVNALAIDGNGNLYVGGGFSTAGSVGANNVAMWNGSSWSPLNSGIGGDIPVILALAVDANNNLYAGGYFTTIGGVSASLISLFHKSFD